MADEFSFEPIDVTVTVTTADLDAMAKVVAPSRVAELAAIVARAGAKELLALATGRAVFSTINDLYKYRIYCLLDCGMGQIEAPTIVAALFQIPIAQAKRLVQQALARYQVELREGWFRDLGEKLDAARFDDSVWKLDLTAFLAERLDEVVAETGVVPPQHFEGHMYAMDNASFQAVLDRLGRPPREPKK